MSLLAAEFDWYLIETRRGVMITEQYCLSLVHGRLLILLLQIKLLALNQLFRVDLKDVFSCGSKLVFEIILNPLVARQHTQLS